jgi:hypothetical protein
MGTLLLAFMPDNFLIVVLVFVGIALTLGIFSRHRAFSYVKIIVLFALLSPFLYAIFDQLPAWLLILIMIGFVFSIARVLLNALFGMGATDQFVGQVMFALFAMPFRIIGNMIRGRR